MLGLFKKHKEEKDTPHKKNGEENKTKQNLKQFKESLDKKSPVYREILSLPANRNFYEVSKAERVLKYNQRLENELTITSKNEYKKGKGWISNHKFDLRAGIDLKQDNYYGIEEIIKYFGNIEDVDFNIRGVQFSINYYKKNVLERKLSFREWSRLVHRAVEEGVAFSELEREMEAENKIPYEISVTYPHGQLKDKFWEEPSKIFEVVPGEMREAIKNSDRAMKADRFLGPFIPKDKMELDIKRPTLETILDIIKLNEPDTRIFIDYPGRDNSLTYYTGRSNDTLRLYYDFTPESAKKLEHIFV